MSFQSTMKALSDPIRREILDMLKKDRLSAGQICEKFEKDNGLFYEPSQIIVSNGAKHSIFNACYALLDEGDEVIIPEPYWLTYPEVVKVCGGVPVYLPCKKENKYKRSINLGGSFHFHITLLHKACGW